MRFSWQERWRKSQRQWLQIDWPCSRNSSRFCDQSMNKVCTVPVSLSSFKSHHGVALREDKHSDTSDAVLYGVT